MSERRTTIIDTLQLRDNAGTGPAFDRLLGDVLDLLNSETRFVQPAKPYQHLGASLIYCGVPDVSHRYLSGETATRDLAASVVEALKRWEPRLPKPKAAPVQPRAELGHGTIAIRVQVERIADDVLGNGEFITYTSAGSRRISISAVR